MPGSFVRDADQVDLLADNTLTTAAGANQTGTAHEIGWSGNTRFELVTAGSAGTTPDISVDIQGSETSDFSDDVVTLATIVGEDPADGTVLGADAYVNSKYVRAVSTVSGSSGEFTGSTVYPVPFHDRRTRSVNPTSKALA